MKDDAITVNKKLALVARFIELYVVRSVNNKTLAYDSIRYTMYNLIKEIRDKEISELAEILKEKSRSFDEKFDGMKGFRMHQQNRRFVHFLLARITNYVEDQCDMHTSRFEDYVDRSAAKPFEIEHIWSDKF